MRYFTYLTEKNVRNTMIGYGVEDQGLLTHQRYIESWFKRYNIQYATPPKLHITIAQVTGTYEKSELIRLLDMLPDNVTFQPKKMNVFKGINFPRDFFVIEYSPNTKFLEAYGMIKRELEIREFPGGPRPHLSLINIPKDTMNPSLMNDMLQMMPKLKQVHASEVELWNSKFNLEYAKRII